MSVTATPIERDLAQASKFRLNFSRLPDLTFFCKTATLPGVLKTEVRIETPFVALYAPGDKIEYAALDVTFLVDVDYQTWFSIYDWIAGLTFPKNFDQYKNLRFQQRSELESQIRKSFNQYSDGSLTIYTNKNNPNIRINFRELFPVALGSIDFDVEKSAEEPITCSASFKFTFYDVERL